MADFKISGGKLVQKSTGKSVSLSDPDVGGNLSKGIKKIRSQKSESKKSKSSSSKKSKSTKTTKGKLVKIEDPTGEQVSYVYQRDSGGSRKVSKSEGQRIEQKVKEQKKKQVAVQKRAEFVEQRAATENRQPTERELRSIYGGIRGQQFAKRHSFINKPFLQTKQQPPRIKKITRQTPYGPRRQVARDVDIPKRQQTQIPEKPFKYNLQEQQVRKVLRNISKEQLKRLEKQQPLILKQAEPPNPIKKGEFFYETQARKGNIAKATAAAIPLAAVRTGKTALQTAAAIPLAAVRTGKTVLQTIKDPFNPQTYKSALSLGDINLLDVGYKYGKEAVRLPYIVPADIAGIYIGNKALSKLLSKGVGKYQARIKGKVKVEVPKGKQVGVFKEITTKGSSQKARLKVQVPSKQVYRLTKTKVSPYLSGKNVFFKSEKAIPKGYSLIRRTSKGVYAQKKIPGYTRFYDVSPQPFKIKSKLLTATKADNIIYQKSLTPQTQTLIVDPRIAKLTIFKKPRISQFITRSKMKLQTKYPKIIKVVQQKAGTGKITGAFKVKKVPQSQLGFYTDPTSALIKQAFPPTKTRLTPIKTSPILRVVQPKVNIVSTPMPEIKRQTRVSIQDFISKEQQRRATQSIPDIKVDTANKFKIKIKPRTTPKIKTQPQTRRKSSSKPRIKTQPISDIISVVTPKITVKQKITTTPTTTPPKFKRYIPPIDDTPDKRKITFPKPKKIFKLKRTYTPTLIGRGIPKIRATKGLSQKAFTGLEARPQVRPPKRKKKKKWESMMI